MKVLLVGNYACDRQRSMERFGEMLRRGLIEQGIEAEIVQPPVVLGRFCKGMRGINKWLGYIDKFLLFRPALRKAVKSRRGWMVHIVDQGNGIYATWLPGCVVTCHDLIAIRAARGEFPASKPGWSGRIFQAMILRGLRKAGRIAAVSGATQVDVARLIGPSQLIPNGIEDSWVHVNPDEAWKRIEDAGVFPAAREAGFLLHVGGDQWYKNRSGVMQAFIELRMRSKHAPKLVLVGPPLDGSMIAALKQAGLSGEAVGVQNVAEDALGALYAMARALVFPSLEEGFGWPIIEAQACGCPVIIADKEPMRETAGTSAIVVRDGKWAKAIAEVLELDEVLRSAVVAGGVENARRFSAKRMVRKYIEFYGGIPG